jgi:hypothetical protein
MRNTHLRNIDLNQILLVLQPGSPLCVAFLSSWTGIEFLGQGDFSQPLAREVPPLQNSLENLLPDLVFERSSLDWHLLRFEIFYRISKLSNGAP